MASILYDDNATIIIFLFVLYCSGKSKLQLATEATSFAKSVLSKELVRSVIILNLPWSALRVKVTDAFAIFCEMEREALKIKKTCIGNMD